MENLTYDELMMIEAILLARSLQRGRESKKYEEGSDLQRILWKEHEQAKSARDKILAILDKMELGVIPMKVG